MKRSIVAALALSLVAAGLLSPASAAKKKKPKPPVVAPAVQQDVTYFLHRTSCGEDTDKTTLSIVDGPDEGDDCGSLESGLLTELFLETGQDPPPIPAVADLGPDRTTFTSEDGVPFVLDATKPIKGSIALGSFCCGAAGISAGRATLQAVLTGTVNGETKTIGEASTDYVVTPAEATSIVEFEIKPDAALDKLSFTTLELQLTNRGVSYLNGFYSYDDPSSQIVVGTWK